MRQPTARLGRAITASCGVLVLALLGAPSAGAVSWSNPHHAYVIQVGYSEFDFTVMELSLDKRPTEKRKLGGPLTRICTLSALAIGPQGNLYASGFFGSHCQKSVEGVAVFAPGAHGNVPPIAMISGETTLMSFVKGIAVDAAGRLYVTSFIGGSNQLGAINIFAPGARGNVAPIASIGGPDTLLAGPLYVALDGGGDIFVGQAQFNTQILKYPPGANGDMAPIGNVSVEPYGNGFSELQISGNTAYVSVGVVREQTPTIYELSTSDLSQTGRLTNPRFTQLFGDVDTAGNLYVENVHRTRGLGCGISRFYEFGAGQSQPSRIRATGTNCGGGYTVVGP